MSGDPARTVDRARAAALETRLQAERKRRLDRAFDEVVSSGTLTDRERRLAHEIAWGTTRLRGRIDHILASRSERPLAEIDPIVLEILRAGLYQALYLDSVPHYAAVSASVTLAKRRSSPGAARFVNGVLRAALRLPDLPGIFPRWSEDPEGHLAHWGSHPRWLIARWLARWGAERTRALVSINNRRPPIFVAPLDGDLAGARAVLDGLADRRVDRRAARNAAMGSDPVGHAAGWSESVKALVPAPHRAACAPHTNAAEYGCIALPSGVPPREALEALPTTIVQGPAARAVATYAGAKPGQVIADLCAAPGGKAFALAAGGARVVAFDLSPSRLRFVAAGARRLKLPVACVAADARNPPLEGCSTVLLDVPCSGTATLARHPDLRWRLGAKGPSEIAGLQASLLAAAARIVTPGGLLVYGTCTLEPEENEEQVSAFLSRHPAFAVERAGTGLPDDAITARGYLWVPPWRTGADGSFAVRLRRHGRQ